MKNKNLDTAFLLNVVVVIFIMIQIISFLSNPTEEHFWKSAWLIFWPIFSFLNILFINKLQDQ